MGSPAFILPRFFFAPLFLIALLGSFGIRPSAFGHPSSVSIAAAANLVYALDALNAAFAETAPATVVTVATGASGNLVAQIENGAPFDVFLSADVEFPQALIRSGHADAPSLATFATGRLVLWTTNPAVALDDRSPDRGQSPLAGDSSSSSRTREHAGASIVAAPVTERSLTNRPQAGSCLTAAVRSDAIRRLAIANLDSAPYGRAARQALEKLGLWSDAQPKLVVGENITQTAQFVETGSADAGFVALSLVLSPKLHDRGRWIEVPADLHAPLDQAAVLTLRGAKNPAAKNYLEFLHTDAAKKILRDFGYAVPRSRTP